jgi:DNA polymerase elongation subunit (family B)
MKYRLIKLWKEDIGGKSVLVWELKSADGEKHTFHSSTLQPRFYLPKKQMIYDDERIVGTEPIAQTHILTGEEMVRVYTDVTSSVGSIRKNTYKPEGVQTSIACQADILFPEVMMIEGNLFAGVEIDDSLLNMDSLPHTEFRPCEPPDVPYITCYLDIECQHPPNVLPDIKREKDVIYLIGVRFGATLKQFWLDNGTCIPLISDMRAYCANLGLPEPDFYHPDNVEVFSEEKELLEAFLDYFESLDPDILTGWNVTFDIDYIMGRCKRYRLGNRWWRCIRKLNIHDSMEAYKRLYRAPSNRLKDVLVHEEIVDDVPDDEHDIMWWREGKNEKALHYNAFYDVICLERLDLKKSIIEHDWGVKEMVGFPDLTPTNWRMPIVDIVALREANGEYILPSKPEYEHGKKREKKKGAIVFQPKSGATYNVAILDFSMYYPYIIIAHNLSKEIPSGQLTPKGIIPKVCEFLIGHRLAAKQAEREALEKFGPESDEKKKAKRLNDVSKFMLNSVFGVTGNPSFRLYEKRVFEDITKYGREGLIIIKQMAEERGFEVIYGDTDSLFIKFDSYEQAEQYAADLNVELNNLYREKYGLTVDFNVEVERWISPVVFSKKRDEDEAGKKRYFYRVVVEDGINLEEIGQDYVVIMGHAQVRRDASPLCKFVQKKVFEDIAFGRISEIEPFLRDCHDKYMSGEFDLDSVAARMTITMKFHQYKQKTVAVRGAEFLNEHMNPSIPVKAGDTVRYLYVKSVDGRRTTDVVSYITEKDIEGRIEIDWEKMFEKQIVAKTEDVLEDVDIFWEQVLGQTDITAFF